MAVCVPFATPGLLFGKRTQEVTRRWPPPLCRRHSGAARPVSREMGLPRPPRDHRGRARLRAPRLDGSPPPTNGCPPQRLPPPNGCPPRNGSRPLNGCPLGGRGHTDGGRLAQVGGGGGGRKADGGAPEALRGDKQPRRAGAGPERPPLPPCGSRRRCRSATTRAGAGRAAGPRRKNLHRCFPPSPAPLRGRAGQALVEPLCLEGQQPPW